MTTATAPTMNPATGLGPLDDHAQSLIDARLDTIERMLLGQVPRADRLAIVRDVEAQVHDLLAGRNPDDTDRDAVIAALGRLDPPEAYLPDEGDAPARSALAPRAAARGPASRVAGPASNRPPRTGGSLVGGIVGIVSLFTAALMLMTLYIAVQASAIDAWAYAFVACRSLSLIASVVALTLAAAHRLRGPWSITGLVTGLISFGAWAVIQCLFPIT